MTDSCELLTMVRQLMGGNVPAEAVDLLTRSKKLPRRVQAIPKEETLLFLTLTEPTLTTTTIRGNYRQLEIQSSPPLEKGESLLLLKTMLESKPALRCFLSLDGRPQYQELVNLKCFTSQPTTGDPEIIEFHLKHDISTLGRVPSLHLFLGNLPATT